MVRAIRVLITAVVFTLGHAQAADTGTIVLNGGFELGRQAWTVGSTSRLSIVDALVHDGEMSIAGGCHIATGTCFGPAGTSFVAQRLYGVPGQTYELTFWALSSAGSTGQIAVDWNAQRLAGITMVDGIYTQYRYSGLYAAGLPNDLKIYLGNSTLNGFTAIDDIAVTRVVPVPEPATAAMLLVGLGLIAYAGRRRIRRRSAGRGLSPQGAVPSSSAGTTSIAS